MAKSPETKGVVKSDIARTLMKTGEASRLLNIHSNTLRRWSERGLIAVYRIGPRGDRRFRREDIAALLIELNREEGVTLIVVTHSLPLAHRIGRVMELRDGALRELEDRR